MSFRLQGDALNYTVRVRAKTIRPRTYLFGSQNVVRRFDGKLVLVIRLDAEGETVQLKGVGPGAEFDICTLEAGQVFAVQVANLAAVWAEQPDADTRIHCTIVPDVA